MADTAGARRTVDPTSKAGYQLAFEDTFDGDALDRARWLPYHLPQRSSRQAAAVGYQLGDGLLRLVIEAEQPPWCPQLDGHTRGLLAAAATPRRATAGGVPSGGAGGRRRHAGPVGPAAGTGAHRPQHPSHPGASATGWGQWEEQLAVMIAQDRDAPPDDLDAHVVAAALVGLLRSVQRVAVAAEMQLDLPALMDHAFDLLESGQARCLARPNPG